MDYYTEERQATLRKTGHLNIKTKVLDIEARVLIGWYSLASQSERVPTRCFYVKVAYLSYGEYRLIMSLSRYTSKPYILNIFLLFLLHIFLSVPVYLYLLHRPYSNTTKWICCPYLSNRRLIFFEIERRREIYKEC